MTAPTQTPGHPPRAWGSWPILQAVHPLRPWLLGAIYLAALLPLTFAPKLSGNVLSRYMTIEAIVERGTLSIERSPLLARSGSPDVVRFGNHVYSDKPPVLPSLATPVYEGLYRSGIRFAGPGGQFLVANTTLTWLVVGLASAWTLVWVRRLLQPVPFAPWLLDGLTLAFGFGSQLFTYAVTFNNHSVAAALILGAVGSTVLERPKRGARWSRFASGFCASLAMTIDLPAGGVSLAGLGFIQLIRARSVPWSFLMGMVGPLLFHVWLQSKVTGTPLPVEMYPEAFLYPGSYWTTPEGTWVEHGPRFWFGIELLFGPQGWFTVTPVLVFGLVGILMVLRRRGDPLRPLAALALGSAVVLVAYYTWGVRRTDFAGWSFGTRHLLAITPVWFVFSIVGLGRIDSLPRKAGEEQRPNVVIRSASAIVFVLLLAVGSVYAYAGFKDPWSRIEKRAPTDPTLRVLQRFVVYPWSSNTR